ncbi:microtubule binding protein [Pleurotus eryngii]|uniref:Microtubule binding protein n=1 Tax=Pleurotus eryngii TaxID=5323 RepID=A0A9P6D4C2_PLEER|nr:microtubule binding protein [Pleurotus eryngii]
MASRNELLAWINDLLQINYTKVEQCGSGAAYCQVLDSIYGDLPMNRVKFNAKHEYEFLTNFKVMQNVFKAKKIDKPIPVERLVKCKMQDNLEFLQWVKRFWDANYGGQGYDPVARRKGASADPPATIAPLGPSTSRTGLSAGARAGGRTPVGGRAGSAQPEVVQQLRAQVQEMSTHLEGLEKERDFYFEKLRDIEILAQQQLETLEAEGKDDNTLREIQKILYSTEEGFEVPEPTAVDEEETF